MAPGLPEGLSTDAPGVSVVICCHNSAARLPETLRCLAEQQLSASVPWEVIVIDNGSTDGTADLARQAWPAGAPAPLRVEAEPAPGLSNARIKGFATASYSFVCFVDDDNRVSPQWIETVYEIMRADPRIGACGGRIQADLEEAPPSWWERFQGAFASGQQWEDEGDITQSKGWLYGAGMTVRKAAWEKLRAQGFEFFCSDRQGRSLTSGGDIELCCALRLSGWKLWLDWRLKMRHLMPGARVNWPYLRRLYSGSGSSSIYLALYGSAQPANWHARLKEHWLWQSFATVKRLLFRPGGLWAYFFSAREGDERVLWAEGQIARLREFTTARGWIAIAAGRIRHAEWLRPPARPGAGSSPP